MTARLRSVTGRLGSVTRRLSAMYRYTRCLVIPWLPALHTTKGLPGGSLGYLEFFGGSAGGSDGGSDGASPESPASPTRVPS